MIWYHRRFLLSFPQVTALRHLPLVVVLSVAGLILTPEGAAAMSKAPPSAPETTAGTDPQTAGAILLSCPTDMPDAAALCTAMEDALTQIAPTRPIRRTANAPVAGQLAIALKITDLRADHMAAHLEWQTEGQQIEQGATLVLSVMDATLSPHMFANFLRDLLKVSHLPI